MVTFDNVPWVATMKNNQYYFPKVKYVKDRNDKNRWSTRRWGDDSGADSGAGGVVDEGTVVGDPPTPLNNGGDRFLEG